MAKLTLSEALKLADRATRSWDLSPDIDPAIKPVRVSEAGAAKTDRVKRIEAVVSKAFDEAFEKAAAKK
jgi:hypothetical protein